ncbi:hypothetical protein ACHAWT_005817 [Skeletonema menzelii]
MADYLKVNACVEKAISEDSTLGDKIETTSATAHPCIEGAADDDAKEACLQPLKQLVHATCPSQFESMESSCCGHFLFRWSCASASFQFEGFALDLAEQLEDGAFWEDNKEEDEFIDEAYEPSKKCQSEGEKLGKCVKKTLADETKDTKSWEGKLKKASKKAEKCAKTLAVDDYDGRFACGADLVDLAGKYCSVNKLKKECKIASFEFEDFVLDLAEVLEPTAYAYYLRG